MKTEKEKMLAGQVYNPGQDKELMAELAACKAKCLRYNQLTAGAEKKELLKSLKLWYVINLTEEGRKVREELLRQREE